MRFPEGNSLGVFLNAPARPLASFAEQVSSGIAPCAVALGVQGGTRSPACSAQGRLRCTQRSSHNVRLASRCRFGSSRSGGALRPRGHALESPRKQGPRLHAIAGRPAPLTPSSNPRLGVESHHQGLHRCALSGFLGPASETRVATRILRHLPVAQNIITRSATTGNEGR